MPIPAHVLIYGRDSSLLETRRMVLETIGGTVHATTDGMQAKQMIANGWPDLLILCYTLSAEDRESILNSAQALRPEIKTLVLSANGPLYTQLSEGAFNTFAGPAALKAKVAQMLDQEEASPAERMG